MDDGKKKKILVYGWYINHNNLGDDFFTEAFQHLFPEVDFTFTDVITKKLLKDFDTVFIGGGSFLNIRPEIDLDAFDELKTKSILYISVGAETEIHPQHLDLLKRAKLVCIRTQDIDKFNNINNNVIYCPDIVYSLPIINSNIKPTPIQKKLVVLNNSVLLPQFDSVGWKINAWNYFKSEFSQALDQLTNDFDISFFGFCNNYQHNDPYASAEIINYTKEKSSYKIINQQPKNFNETITILDEFDFIITQRYHGIVLAEMLKKPYISIYHHDKLKTNQDNYISYYNLNKNLLLNKINNYNQPNKSINLHIFEELKHKVNAII